MKKINRTYKYLSYINPFGTPETVFLSVLVRIAQMGIMNRIMIKSPVVMPTGDHTTTATLYAQTYEQSGSGKDKPVRDLRRITTFFEEDFARRYGTYVGTHNEETMKSGEGMGMKKRELERYVKENAPRQLATEISNGTMEGFLADREEFSRAGFGGVFIKISEFGDFITDDSQQRVNFLSTLVETYDNGSTSATSTKSSKTKMAVDLVPTACYVYTDPYGLFKGKKAEKLKTFLARGFARRSLTNFPLVVPVTITDKEAKKQADRDLRERAASMERDIVDYFRSFYEWTGGDNIYTLTAQAENAYSDYEIDCHNAAINIQGPIASEISGRPWKAVKLAGLIAAFERPESQVVDEDDLLSAIKICEKYGLHFARFYNAREKGSIEALEQYFLSHEDQWVTLGDMRTQEFVTEREFGGWFEDALSQVESNLNTKGYVIEQAKHGKSNLKYRILKNAEVPEHASFIVSQAESNDKTETKFLQKETTFRDLEKIILTDRAWSPARFRNNYRKNENVILSFRVIAYDIDSGMTIEQATELLETQQIRAIIATSKSHRKEKNGVVADRFRVIFPLLYEWAPESPEQYRTYIRTMAKKLGLPIDRAATDAARFFYGNPLAEITHIVGNAVDISIYQEQPGIQRLGVVSTKTIAKSDTGIMQWYVDNLATFSGRNAMLFQVGLFFITERKLTRAEAHQKILEVNAMLPEPLPIPEIERTLFKTPALDNPELSL